MESHKIHVPNHQPVERIAPCCVHPVRLIGISSTRSGTISWPTPFRCRSRHMETPNPMVHHDFPNSMAICSTYSMYRYLPSFQTHVLTILLKSLEKSTRLLSRWAPDTLISILSMEYCQWNIVQIQLSNASVPLKTLAI